MRKKVNKNMEQFFKSAIVQPYICLPVYLGEEASGILSYNLILSDTLSRITSLFSSSRSDGLTPLSIYLRSISAPSAAIWLAFLSTVVS